MSESVCVCVCAPARTRACGPVVCVCVRESDLKEGVCLWEIEIPCVCVCVFTQTGILRQRKCAGSPSVRPDFLLWGRGEKSCGSVFRQQQRQRHGAPTQHTLPDLRPKHKHARADGHRSSDRQQDRCKVKFLSTCNFLDLCVRNRSI